MEFPREVPHGLPVNELTKEFNKAVRVLRALRPVSSTTVRVESISNGTTYHLRGLPAGTRRSGGGTSAGLANSAFVATVEQGEVDNVAVTEVKMLCGTAQGIFGELQDFPTTYWTTAGELKLFDDANDDLDTVNASQTLPDGTWFWLRWDPQEEEWTLEKGATLPANASVAAGDTVQYFAVVPLFRLRLTDDDAKAVQMHYGSVYVPTARNVIDIQEVASQ